MNPPLNSTPTQVAPEILFHLDLLSRTRQRMLEIVAGLPQEQLLKIPSGFHNNLLWNLGHVLVSFQALVYEKSGQPIRVPTYIRPLFAKGSRPGDWMGSIDVTEVKTWLLETPKLFLQDAEQGIFGEFTPYETSMGIRLGSLRENLAYATWHEAQHFGTLLALRKLV